MYLSPFPSPLMVKALWRGLTENPGHLSFRHRHLRSVTHNVYDVRTMDRTIISAGTIQELIVNRLFLCILVFLVALTNGCSGDDWSSQSVNTTKARGDTIVSAVRQYHEENKQYPDTLESLVPRYLAKIDSPTVGDEVWMYLPHSPSGTYALKVRSHSKYDPVLYYSSGDNAWHMDTK